MDKQEKYHNQVVEVLNPMWEVAMASLDNGGVYTTLGFEKRGEFDKEVTIIVDKIY